MTAVVRAYGPPALAAAQVRAAAALCDDVLVAAGPGFDGGDLAHVMAAGAHRALRLPPHEGPPEASDAYLRSQAIGAWILWLGDRLVPGAALAAAVRATVAREDVTHLVADRAWLWPDPAHVLDARPWLHDHRPLLARNDPALVHFPGTAGSAAAVAGGAVRVGAPAYDPGMLIGAVPGPAEGVPTRGVDPADAALVAGLLDAAPGGERSVGGGAARPASGASGEPPAATPAEVDLEWAARPYGKADYSARLSAGERDLGFAAREGRVLHVAVENQGAATWPWHATGRTIALAYRWLHHDGGVAVPYGRRTPLPGPLRPGERTLVGLSVVAPAAGSLVLEVDLVDEHRDWFRRPLRLPVEVRA